MTEEDRIKKHYIRPPIVHLETEWNEYKYGLKKGKLDSLFHIEQIIWLDHKSPEYRVAIPENMSNWQDDEIRIRNANNGSNSIDNVCLRTRFITYKPTGRIVYDNTLPPPRAIVFEYRIEIPSGQIDKKSNEL